MSAQLTSKYLGFELRNPLVASASPLTGRLDSLKALEDSGIAAVVLPSLFEEQIDHESTQIGRLQDLGTDSFAESLDGFFPELDDYNMGSDHYLELIRSAKSTLDVPVIASLNGVSLGGWVEHARFIEEAGADALELNMYLVPSDPDASGAEVEAQYLELVQGLRQATKLPLAVKLSPFFSAPVHMARKLVLAGANGVVLFNRFYQPDIDLETLTVRPDIQLSTGADLRLPLRWTAIMRGHVDVSIGTTSGCHTSEDVLKLLLAGADATMMTSALLRHGPRHVRPVLEGVQRWLDEREYESVEQMKGSLSQANSPDPNAFERANYLQGLTSYSSEWLA